MPIHLCSDCGLINRLSDKCCINEQLIFVRYKIANDTIQLRKGCLNCKQIQPKSYKKAEYLSEFNSAPILTSEVNRQRSDKKSKEWSMIHELSKRIKKEIIEEISIQYRQQYEEHLQSEYWHRIRKKVLLRDDFLCQGCLENQATQVHHTTYSHLGNELAFQLISLCASCHSKVHNQCN